MKFLAFDPDTATTGWALIESVDGKGPALVTCGIVKSSGSLTGDERVNAQMKALHKVLPTIPRDFDMVMVEGQYNRSGTNIQDVLRVARVGGCIQSYYATRGCVTVTPELWTQSKGKEMREGSVLRRLRLTMADIAQVTGLSEAMSEHAVDAAAQAVWLSENFTSRTFLDRFKRKAPKKSAAKNFSKSTRKKWRPA